MLAHPARPLLLPSFGSLKPGRDSVEKWLMHPAYVPSVRFDLPAESIHEIFRVQALVETGRNCLSEFFGLYSSGKVTFEPYPDRVVAELRRVTGPDVPIGACFECDGERGRIHYDPSSALGVLCPFLIHEMVHALDLTLWEAAKKSPAEARRRQLMLDAESVAFEYQARFTTELRELLPEYREFLANHFPKASVLHELLGPEAVKALYQKF